MNLISLLASFDNLNPMNMDVIFKALNILWQGMLAIFVVIGLIVITVKIANAIIVNAEKAKQEREKQAEKSNDNPA